jgi:hypothetical protein
MGSEQIALSFSTLPSSESLRCPRTIARARRGRQNNNPGVGSTTRNQAERSCLRARSRRLNAISVWVFRPDKAAFKNMLQHLRRITAGFDLLIMENFILTALGELHAMSC